MKRILLPFLLWLMSLASLSASFDHASPEKTAQKILNINYWQPGEIKKLLLNYERVTSDLVKHFYTMLILISDLDHLQTPEKTGALFMSQELLSKNAWYASLDAAQALTQSDAWNIKANPLWRAAVEQIEDARDEVLWVNRSKITITNEQNADLNDAEQVTRKILAREAFEGTKGALEKLNLKNNELIQSASTNLAMLYILALLSEPDCIRGLLANFFIILSNANFQPLSGSAFHNSMSKNLKRLPNLENNIHFISCKKFIETITTRSSGNTEY